MGIYKFNSPPKGISPKEHWMVHLNEVSERRKKKDLLSEERSDEFKSSRSEETEQKEFKEHPQRRRGMP